MGCSLPPRRPSTILLVDDDRALVNAISFALATDGHRVEAFTDPQAALRGLPRAADCIVVDQNLPGLSGLDLLDAMRARGVLAPAVLITTAPSPATRARASADGVEIVEKPLLSDALNRAVARLINAAQARP